MVTSDHSFIIGSDNNNLIGSGNCYFPDNSNIIGLDNTSFGSDNSNSGSDHSIIFGLVIMSQTKVTSYGHTTVTS
jgi:hypothetical protein